MAGLDDFADVQFMRANLAATGMILAIGSNFTAGIMLAAT